MVSQSHVTLHSKCTIFPHQKSTTPDLKLSVSDLPMLSCHYIQKGGLYAAPPIPIPDLISLLKRALSQTLTQFPPLAGRLATAPDGHVYIACNDAGVDFFHSDGSHLQVTDLLGYQNGDVPEIVKSCFPYDCTVSYEGHCRPLVAVQVTALADGVFIGYAVNHAIVDGTSLWNFVNAFAERSRGVRRVAVGPDFRRDSVLISAAVLRFPEGGPAVNFAVDAPIRERIFSFTKESMLKLKAKVNYYYNNNNNNNNNNNTLDNGGVNAVELMGKQANDTLKFPNEKLTPLAWLRRMVPLEMMSHDTNSTVEISSFQSLSALLWRGITRARKLPASKTTTFRMAVNCRHRLEPRLEPMYFGNAIQSVPTCAFVGHVVGKDLRWCAEQLNRSVAAHGNAKVRECVEDWERRPRCFPLGNPDGAMVMMGSSPRFPMYENDFGWGRPVVVRSGRANKFDGKISAFPGREGGGSVDLEVVLAPETMAGLEADPEFMQYVSVC